MSTSQLKPPRPTTRPTARPAKPQQPGPQPSTLQLQEQVRTMDYAHGAKILSPNSAGLAPKPPPRPSTLQRKPQSQLAPKPQTNPQPQPGPAPVQGAPQPQPEPQQPPAPEGSGPPAENLQSAERLGKGAVGLGHVKGMVEQRVAQKKQDVEETNAKRSGIKKLLGAGKKKDATIPLYQEAVTNLGAVKGTFEEVSTKVRAAPKPFNDLLPAAARQADKAADRMTGKVDTPLVDNVHDVATFVRSGEGDMLQRVIARGADILSDGSLANRKKLGEGGQGAVWGGDYLGITPIARKHTTSSQNGDEVKGECDAMGACESPNVLKTYGSFEKGNSVGYIMELARKGDLKGLQKQLSAMKLEERMEVVPYLMRGSFKGLLAVHGQGKIHGDIKNDNIVIGDDYEPKLMDFGLVQEANATDKKIVGSESHMAPEVMQGKIEKASDIWSMGETMLIMLFGANSLGIHKGETVMRTNALGQGTEKGTELKGGEWLGKVAEKVKLMPPEKKQDGERLLDFLRKVMAFDPKERMGAQQALDHEFLSLQNTARGKEKLKTMRK